MKEVVVIDGEGKERKVIIGKIKYGKMVNILQKYFKTSASRDALKSDIEHFAMMRDMLIASIVSVAPPVDNIEKFIDELSYDEGRKLEDAMLELNPLR